MRALVESDHEEVRTAAPGSLRRWVARSPENGAILRNELGQSFVEQDADIAYRLLWGFTSTDALDPDLSREMIAWMDHDHVAIRELAFHNVERLTGERYNYRPQMTATMRQPAKRSTDRDCLEPATSLLRCGLRAIK